MAEDITIPQEAVREYTAGIAAWRKADRSLVVGRMKAGEHWSEAVRLSVESVESGKAGMRAACIARIAGLIGRPAGDVGEAICAWQAYKLLHLGGGYGTTAKDAIPSYSHWRDGWSKLVQRASASDGAESYALLAGLEEQCKAAYAEGSAWKWDEDGGCPGVKQLIATVVADHARLVKMAADETAKRLAARVATAPTEEERKAITRDLARAERAAEKAADDVAKANGKANGKAKPQADGQAGAPWTALGKSAIGRASLGDAAQSLWDLIAEHPERESVLYLLAQCQSKDGDCSSTFRSAFAAFAVVWTRKSKIAA